MKFFVVFQILLLIYLILPGPSRIDDFDPLPNSYKSWLDGDTVQVPNVAAYFSDNFRADAINFYKNIYQSKLLLPIPPIRLNYPPEYSFYTVKQHTDSTYLEEFIYPLRDSFFVNGFEPFLEDLSPRWWGALEFKTPDGAYYHTKVTLRYYPSNIFLRLILWALIGVAIIYLYRLGKEVLVEK